MATAGVVAPLRSYLRLAFLLLAGAAALPGCGERQPCARCETLVIAAVGEPDHLLPPFVWQSLGRDIADFMFERLAVLEPGRSPLDSGGYRPGLAASWARVDSSTWLFHLRPGARWHDGTPVRAADVEFSFAAYQDSALDAPDRGSLAGLRAAALDDSTVEVTFRENNPAQLYDATWHVRIFPRHVWDSIPRDQWGSRTAPERLIGSGPYRLSEWRRGERLNLEAVDASSPLRRILWIFAQAPDALLSLALSGEADLIESLPDPASRRAAEGAPHLRLIEYPSAVYGFLGFNLARPGGWADPRVRHALRLALDRETLAQAVIGPGTQVPYGPYSAQLWLWETPPPSNGDTALAAALLDQAEWRRSRGKTRRRGNQSLVVDILVPATSAMRRDLAVAIQERWARLGVTASVTAVDFPVFQERLAQGRFDTFIGSWLDEPHPRSLSEQWTRAGHGQLNYGHYANPVFDSLFHSALASTDTAITRVRWREAMDTLNQDAPAIWLFTPVNIAVADSRVHLTAFRPFAWLYDLPSWRLDPPSR